MWKKMVHASVKLDSLETCVMNASEDTMEQPVKIAIQDTTEMKKLAQVKTMVIFIYFA